ncbi:MAG: hypothetical protein PWQ59_2131 [Thermoanaerobacterium sp.]|nr:hypothetical protein [Thermoanaerobacterium sp.]
MVGSRAKGAKFHSLEGWANGVKKRSFLFLMGGLRGEGALIATFRNSKHGKKIIKIGGWKWKKKEN